jgi:hypothetical protein
MGDECGEEGLRQLTTLWINEQRSTVRRRTLLLSGRQSFMALGIVLLVLLGRLQTISCTVTPTNGFTQDEVQSWSNLHLEWLQQGFMKSSSILNCSNIDYSDPLHDPEKTKFGFPTDQCIRTYLRGMCGSLGLATDAVPHSHICDGSIREFGNYRFVPTSPLANLYF